MDAIPLAGRKICKSAQLTPFRRLKVGNLESVKRDHFRPEVVPFQRPLTQEGFDTRRIAFARRLQLAGTDTAPSHAKQLNEVGEFRNGNIVSVRSEPAPVLFGLATIRSPVRSALIPLITGLTGKTASCRRWDWSLHFVR